MRKIKIFAIILLVFWAFCIPASAQTEASMVSVAAQVRSDESCQITVTAQLHMEEGSGIRFPVPADAESITLNGSRVRTSATDQKKYIDISKELGGITGDITVTVQYNLPDVVENRADGRALLRLPLLSGFEHRIKGLEFSVTLPGTVPGKPAYSSGYYQANIEKDLTSSVSGSVITGRSLVVLQDHETLEMTLNVDQAMFPDAPLVFYTSNTDDTAMLVCALAALLYWLLFLRTLPPHRRVSAITPAGATAGHLDGVLTLGKADLTMMVLSWAQMGYITIQLDKKGRVLLHKRMEMGNERSNFEQRCFRDLFLKREVADTSGLSYAQLCKTVSRTSPGVQSMVHPRSGNPKLFRWIAALCGLFGGIGVGVVLTQDALVQGVWIALIALIGLICSYCMQLWARDLFSYRTDGIWKAVLAFAVWMILCVIAGQAGVGVTVTLIQLLAGLMAFYGGRRTPGGREDMSQVLALRRFLRTVTRPELDRLCMLDPDYFHNQMPYAYALGVDRAFARRFGKKKISGCPWLTYGQDSKKTAAEWAHIHRQTVEQMQRRYKGLGRERILAIFGALKK